MKIVHVISGLTKGGGERVAVELANKSVENGDEVTILAGWKVDPAFLQKDVDGRIEVKFISEKRKYAYLNSIPWIIKNNSWINAKDVIHCHLTFGGIFGVLLKIFFLKRNFMVIETYHAVGMNISKFKRWLHSKLILLKDGVVFMANDFYWDTFIEKHKNLKNKVIPNGIRLFKVEKNEIDKKSFIYNLTASKCNFLVGTVGMLRPDRNPLIYVEIVKYLKKSLGENVHFILGGDGSEYEKIDELKKELNLEKSFHMLGLIESPTEIFSKLDVYVSLCVKSTVGISIIEAAMCKVPVVGIQLLEDYKARESDWVWSHSSAKKVAERIGFLLKNEREREKLAEKQYNYVVENLTSDAMYLKYKSFYKEILK